VRQRPLVEVVPDYLMDTVTGETMPSMEDTVGCKADSWLRCIGISIDIYMYVYIRSRDSNLGWEKEVTKSR
jgi:hypothetical protein